MFRLQTKTVTVTATAVAVIANAVTLVVEPAVARRAVTMAPTVVSRKTLLFRRPARSTGICITRISTA